MKESMIREILFRWIILCTIYLLFHISDIYLKESIEKYFLYIREYYTLLIQSLFQYDIVPIESTECIKVTLLAFYQRHWKNHDKFIQIR